MRARVLPSNIISLCSWIRFDSVENGRKLVGIRSSQEKGDHQIGAGEIHQRCTYCGRLEVLSVCCYISFCGEQELVARVIQLETHNQHLKNIIKKELVNADGTANTDDNNQRKFDFAKWVGEMFLIREQLISVEYLRSSHRRHVLLKLYYLGWDYQGFATQENSGNTIEHHLFAALKKTCLIASRETSNYHRCGRTDKGVSAFSQVISIDVRSKYPPEQQMTPEAIQSELRYCETLNRVLPKDIRCTAWQPLYNGEFSSRFDCRQRTYRYFFPRSNLDIDAMKVACTYLIGSHDFRNLCKMDVGNGVVTFIREIRDARITLAAGIAANAAAESAFDMFYFELTAKAFLWHQVRCIVAILLLVGQRNEQPAVIRQLLDVTANPCTPQYSLASDIPLNLFHVEYEEYSTSSVTTGDVPAENIGWMYDSVNLSRVIGVLQEQWTKLSVKYASVGLDCGKHFVIGYIWNPFFSGTKWCAKCCTFSRTLTKRNSTKALSSGTQTPCRKASSQKLTRNWWSEPNAVRNQSWLRRILFYSSSSFPSTDSLENRIEHYAKKRRIEIVNKDESDARPIEITTSHEEEDDGNEWKFHFFHIFQFQVTKEASKIKIQKNLKKNRLSNWNLPFEKWMAKAEQNSLVMLNCMCAGLPTWQRQQSETIFERCRNRRHMRFRKRKRQHGVASISCIYRFIAHKLYNENFII